MAGIVGGGGIGGALGVGALVTKATGVQDFSIVKGLVFVIAKTKIIVYYGYVPLATVLGYGYYQISEQLYESIDKIQRWAMNSQFLVDCTKLGANFIVEPNRAIGASSWLYHEIAFLVERGYKWLEDLSALVKGLF